MVQIWLSTASLCFETALLCFEAEHDVLGGVVIIFMLPKETLEQDAIKCNTCNFQMDKKT